MTIRVVGAAGFMRKIFADNLQAIGFVNAVATGSGLDALKKRKWQKIV